MSKKYLYENIYVDLKEAINNGVYKPGDRIPTESELSKTYDVSRITSQKAVNLLMEEGFVIRHAGMGTFVSSDEDKYKDKDKEIIKIEEISNNTNIDIKNQSNVDEDEEQIIGFIMESLWSCFGVGLFDGAYERAQELGYNLILKKSYGEQQKEINAIRSLIKLGASGIIVMPVHGDYYSEELLKLVVNKYPLVFIDRYLEGINVPIIATDNVESSKSVVEYFIKRGHKNIGLVTMKPGEATTLDERKKGYIKGHIENNININIDYIYENIEFINRENENQIDLFFNKHIKSIENYLLNNKELSAIFTSEYYIATLVKLAAQNIGINIPDDLEIVCFDQPKKLMGEYEFTFVSQREYEVGKSAVDTLKHIIDGKSVQRKILIEADLVQGKSTKK